MDLRKVFASSKLLARVLTEGSSRRPGRTRSCKRVAAALTSSARYYDMMLLGVDKGLKAITYFGLNI